jgi:hypothetical protein
MCCEAKPKQSPGNVIKRKAPDVDLSINIGRITSENHPQTICGACIHFPA